MTRHEGNPQDAFVTPMLSVHQRLPGGSPSPVSFSAWSGWTEIFRAEKQRIGRESRPRKPIVVHFRTRFWHLRTSSCHLRSCDSRSPQATIHRRHLSLKEEILSAEVPNLTCQLLRLPRPWFARYLCCGSIANQALPRSIRVVPHIQSSSLSQNAQYARIPNVSKALTHIPHSHRGRDSTPFCAR